MSKSKKVPMSLSIDPSFANMLTKAAKKRGINRSKLAYSILKKCVVDEDEFQTIVVHIPVDVKTKPEELKKWLELRFDALYHLLLQSNEE